ncbi:MAG: glycosyltransferase family 2 protein [Candidatus Saccharimonadales bacterium]
MNRLAVIVLNWNGIDDTLLCFDSLLKQSISDFKIIIIDNGSIDNSKDVLQKLQISNSRRLTVLYNPVNKGFAGGVNTGINWVIKNDYELVALFNNDAVADSNWLKSLVDESGDETVGIVTGLLLHEDGKTIDSTGDWYTNWGLPFPRNRNEPVGSAPDKQFVFSGSGGASLYKTELLKDIGLFDEDFFAYYEDTDVSFRTQLAGWKVIYTPKAVAYHKQGATSNKIPGFAVYQTFKNLPLLLIKDVPVGLYLPIAIRFYFAYWLMFINTFKHRRGWSATKGIFMSIVFTPRKLRERWHIQRVKRVKTSYIKSILWDDLPPDQTGIRKVRKMFIGK